MKTESIAIAEIVARWESAERPLFKGALIDAQGCVCAQGDVLRVCGYTDSELGSLTQGNADKEVARLLGVSTTHAILLRQINDKQDGCPQDVLAHPGKILGPRAQEVLAFWWHLDGLTPAAWAAAGTAARAAGAAAWAAAGTAAGAAAWDAAGTAAWAAAWDAAGDAAGAAAWAAAWDAAGTAAWAAAWAAAGTAARASSEVQGYKLMQERKQEPYFVKFVDYEIPA